MNDHKDNMKHMSKGHKGQGHKAEWRGRYVKEGRQL